MGTSSQNNHGAMDITAQEKTFHGFIRFIKWSVGIIVIMVIFLALYAT